MNHSLDPIVYEFNRAGLLERYFCPLCGGIQDFSVIGGMRWADVVIRYKYDEQGRLTEKTEKTDTVSYQVSAYTYPEPDKRVQKCYTMDATGTKPADAKLSFTCVSELDSNMREVKTSHLFEWIHQGVPEEREFSYNEHGDNIKRTIDARVNSNAYMAYDYDVRGLKTKQYWWSEKTPKRLAVIYTYNNNGLLLNWIDNMASPPHIYTYKYYYW